VQDIAMSQADQSPNEPQKSKNFVTPLKKEPMLFGQKVPSKVVVPERPKAPEKPKAPQPPASEMPPPPPPVEGVPAMTKVQEPRPFAPPPTVTAKPPRAPRPEVIRKMPDLNRRAFAVEEDVEAELENALAGMEADTLYAADSASTRPSGGGGQTKKGKVISIHGDDVFVDIGGRSQGVLPLDSFAETDTIAIGKEVEVIVKGFDSANGIMLLALPGAAERSVDWSSVTRGMIVEARVTGTNKGGLSVEVNGIRGFMPISQLELFRVDDTNVYVNQRIRALVAEVDPAEKNLVLSRRALLEQEREKAKEQLWATLAEGQRRSAVVGNIKDFGAFVDLGGADALLPAGEMAWEKVADPAKYVSPGQRIEVKVIRLDAEKKKVTVSLRQCMASPWDEVENKYPVGSIVNGTVTRTADYGAFVELEPGVEGLLHISELASKRVMRTTDIVKVGATVEVKVIKYDPEQKRLSLSLKAVQKEKEAAAQADAPAESETPEPPAKPIHRRTDLKGGLSN
jgi:small subunit ribosomal protein S1